MTILYRCDIRTARKKHECAVCGSVIRKYSRYVDVNTKEVGKFHRYCLHSMCFLIARRYCEDNNRDPQSLEELESYFKKVYCSKCVNIGVCKFSMSQCLHTWA